MLGLIGLFGIVFGGVMADAMVNTRSEETDDATDDGAADDDTAPEVTLGDFLDGALMSEDPAEGSSADAPSDAQADDATELAFGVSDAADLPDGLSGDMGPEAAFDDRFDDPLGPEGDILAALPEVADAPDDGIPPPADDGSIVILDTPQVLQAGDEGGILSGGTADDTLTGGAGRDLIGGRDGDDLILGADGDDHLNGEAGADSLSGGDGADVVEGGACDDQALGGEGDDTLNGHIGDDSMAGGDGADSLNGGDGDDLLLGESGDDTLVGGYGDDALVGSTGRDLMLGGAGNDLLIGLEPGEAAGSDDTDAADQLNGGAGDDTLLIGAGDQAHGGSGADRFVLGAWIGANDPAARIEDYDPAEDQLLVVYDALAHPDPVLTVEYDPDHPGAARLHLNGVLLAEIVGAEPLSVADITLVAHAPGASTTAA